MKIKPYPKKTRKKNIDDTRSSCLLRPHFLSSFSLLFHSYHPYMRDLFQLNLWRPLFRRDEVETTE